MPEPSSRRGDGVAIPPSPLLPLENAWLHETSAKLRTHRTAWEGYQRAGLVTAEQVQMLRDAEQAARTHDMAYVMNRGSEHAHLYISLLDKLSRIDTMQAVLLLLDDLLLAAAPAHLDWFLHGDHSLYETLQKYVAHAPVANAGCSKRTTSLLR